MSRGAISSITRAAELAVEATWIAAQELGLAVAPISPPFLYATNDEELQGVSPKHAEELATLQSRFRTVAGIGDHDETVILVLRLSTRRATTVRSRRRSVKMDPCTVTLT